MEKKCFKSFDVNSFYVDIDKLGLKSHNLGKYIDLHSVSISKKS